jgi:cation diffusion facilitator family transporter
MSQEAATSSQQLLASPAHYRLRGQTQVDGKSRHDRYPALLAGGAVGRLWREHLTRVNRRKRGTTPPVASESKRTVLVAFGANLAIAVAKLAAGLISGSSSMLAEAAHSFADTLNQVFLLTSLTVSRRPADPEHPFGYGKAQFFWSLLAAVGIFVAGSVFSIYQGVHTLRTGGEESGGILVPYVVLGVSFVAEGISWLRALKQMRGEASDRGRSLRGHVGASKDPTVKTVLAEDSAALIGIVLAAVGVGLHHLTGNADWDGWAAIAIGVLLAVVAFVLGRDNSELLIGQAAEPGLVVDVYDQVCAREEVIGVVELLTMHLGPEQVLVAIRLELADSLPAGEVERLAGTVDEELRSRHPEITQVFLDPTRPDPELASRTAVHVERLRARAENPNAAPEPVSP